MERLQQRVKGWRKVESINIPGVMIMDPLYVYDPLTPKVTKFIRTEHKWMAMFVIALLALLSK